MQRDIFVLLDRSSSTTCTHTQFFTCSFTFDALSLVHNKNQFLVMSQVRGQSPTSRMLSPGRSPSFCSRCVRKPPLVCPSCLCEPRTSYFFSPQRSVKIVDYLLSEVSVSHSCTPPCGKSDDTDSHNNWGVFIFSFNFRKFLM